MSSETEFMVFGESAEGWLAKFSLQEKFSVNSPIEALQKEIAGRREQGDMHGVAFLQCSLLGFLVGTGQDKEALRVLNEIQIFGEDQRDALPRHIGSSALRIGQHQTALNFSHVGFSFDIKEPITVVEAEEVKKRLVLCLAAADKATDSAFEKEVDLVLPYILSGIQLDFTDHQEVRNRMKNLVESRGSIGLTEIFLGS